MGIGGLGCLAIAETVWGDDAVAFWEEVVVYEVGPETGLSWASRDRGRVMVWKGGRGRCSMCM